MINDFRWYLFGGTLWYFFFLKKKLGIRTKFKFSIIRSHKRKRVTKKRRITLGTYDKTSSY
eukprot:SAG31_NODE_2580_length_5438_cov_8.500843_2_plen_61_part_00